MLYGICTKIHCCTSGGVIHNSFFYLKLTVSPIMVITLSTCITMVRKIPLQYHL